MPNELLEVTNDRCFENRKCNTEDADAADLFVGASTKCTCADASDNLNQTSVSSQRYKRQTGEAYIISANAKRVLRARLGGRRLARDTQRLTRRKGDYTLIRNRFRDYTESFEEEDFELIY